jgi:hypothetical protein
MGAPMGEQQERLAGFLLLLRVVPLPLGVFVAIGVNCSLANDRSCFLCLPGVPRGLKVARILWTADANRT